MKPIGFFDSGVGGISVLKTAYELMPNENYIYYGDNANAPYGEKNEEQIKQLSLKAGAFLFEKGVKAIVMACNTATSAAVIMMRERYSIPVISMEPAVKPALASEGKVLVLATPATVSQARYLGLIERLSAQDRVVSVGCGGLVELIEQGKTDEKSIHDCLAQRLSGLTTKPVGAVVLGCTHYSFVESHIKSYIDKAFHTDCRVFDGRQGTALHLEHVLVENGIRSNSGKPGSVTYFASRPDGSEAVFESLFHNFKA